MPLDDETRKKLRGYARNRSFDEKAFVYEVERAMHDLGKSLDDAIPHAEKLFEESAYKAKAAGQEAGRGSGGKAPVVPAPTPKPAATTLINQYQKGMDEAQKFNREGRPTTQKTAFEKLIELVGNHLIEIYSDAGNGKSRLAHHIATEAERSGRKVL